MSEYPVWWTHCPKCDISVTIETDAHGPNLMDPDDLDGFIECPYDGSSLTGWNGDPVSASDLLGRALRRLNAVQADLRLHHKTVPLDLDAHPAIRALFEGS